MAFLGSPPQTYWTSFDQSFDPQLDPALTADPQQTSADPTGGAIGSHSLHGISGHSHHGGAGTAGAVVGAGSAGAGGAADHMMDPALTEEIPHQGPIIFHQGASHGFAPPPPGFADQGLPPPPASTESMFATAVTAAPAHSSTTSPLQATAAAAAAAVVTPSHHHLHSQQQQQQQHHHHNHIHHHSAAPQNTRVRQAKELHHHQHSHNPHNGEVMMDEVHGGAYIAPQQHNFFATSPNGIHHTPDMAAAFGGTQPQQIKFRATANTSSSSGGGHGRKPKMTKEEQMARRRLRTDTDEYRTQERERMRRRRAREKDDKDRVKKDQEDMLRAEGKETWIAPPGPSGAPKKKSVKIVKKKTDATAEDDTSRDGKRQAKVNNRAAAGNESSIVGDASEASLHPEDSIMTTDLSRDYDDFDTTDDRIDESDLSNILDEGDDKARLVSKTAKLGAVSPTTPNKSGRFVFKSTPSSALKTASSTISSPSTSQNRAGRGKAGSAEGDKAPEIVTTRSGRTTRSAISTPAKVAAAAAAGSSTAASPAGLASTPGITPAKLATKKQTVTTQAASPSQPAVNKTRVSLKTLIAGGVMSPSAAESKSPISGRDKSNGGAANGGAAPSGPPVVMLFGYPAGANPPCDVSSVSVTVENTKTSKVCMMNAAAMRRSTGTTPPVETAAPTATAGEKMEIDGSGDAATTTAAPGGAASDAGGSANSRPSTATPDPNANNRFSWDLVVENLRQDIGFDPERDELVGFHHKDPLFMSCDRHINTALVMAAKEGVRMPKWYVYEKSSEPV